MKFLTVPRLQRLSSLLNHVDLGDQIIHARVEAYSCKAAGDDKRLGKQLERQISEELAHSPSLSPTMSPLGPLTDANTRKLLISLITTMNASFPDYDFSNLRAEQFERELSPTLAMTSLNSLFLDSLEPSQPGVRAEFWQAIAETIDLPQCELYTFTPHPDSDLDEGKLWSVRQFFYHRKEKKVVFVAASAVSKLHDDDEEEDGDDDLDLAMSSSGGEGHWDDLDLGDDARPGEEPPVGQRSAGREMVVAGRVREVTASTSPSSGARRPTKAKRAPSDEQQSAVRVDNDGKRKRRRKRAASGKGLSTEKASGKRPLREIATDAAGSGVRLGPTARATIDDEERGGGGRSLLDPKRAPSPAVSILPLASLVDAKHVTEEEQP